MTEVFAPLTLIETDANAKRHNSNGMANRPSDSEYVVAVDIPTRAGLTTFANRFFIEPHSAGKIIYFCHRSSLGFESPALAVEVSFESLAIAKQNLVKYVEDVGKDIPRVPKWTPESVSRIHTANILQLARTGESAETTFVAVLTHAVIEGSKKAKKDSKDSTPPVVGGTIVFTVRSPLALQLELIRYLLDDAT